MTELRKPDASFIRKVRLATLGGSDDVGYMNIPVDLVVEVLSKNDLVRGVKVKVEEHLAASFPLI